MTRLEACNLFERNWRTSIGASLLGVAAITGIVLGILGILQILPLLSTSITITCISGAIGLVDVAWIIALGWYSRNEETRIVPPSIHESEVSTQFPLESESPFQEQVNINIPPANTFHDNPLAIITSSFNEISDPNPSTPKITFQEDLNVHLPETKNLQETIPENIQAHSQKSYITIRTSSISEKISENDLIILKDEINKISKKFNLDIGFIIDKIKKLDIGLHVFEFKKISILISKKNDQSYKIRIYTIIEILGKGAFGIVYSVQNVMDKTIWALKCGETHNDILVGKAILKGKPKNALQHIVIPLRYKNCYKYHIPSNELIYLIQKEPKELNQWPDTETSPFLMPFYEGTLEKYVTSHKSTDIKLLFNIFDQIFLGLKELNELGIIHHDLSTANILFKMEGENKIPHLYITDFGRSEIDQRKLFCYGDCNRLGKIIGAYIYANWLDKGVFLGKSEVCVDILKLSQELIEKGYTNFSEMMEVLGKMVNMQYPNLDSCMKEWDQLKSKLANT